MPAYKHTQRANWMLGIFGAVVLIEIAVFAVIGLDTILLVAAVAPAIVIVALLTWLFSSMTVEVTPSEVRWHFGPGFWKKSMPRAEIAKAEAGRSKWWYGWGIRLTPQGWLYNVSGLDIVALRTHDGKTTMIGTDRPGELVAALAR